MTKQYTVSEVMELQNQKKQLEQRIAIHKQRAAEKQNELQAIFAQAGVKDIQELSNLCATMNATMQEYAAKEEQNIQNMKAYCDELDRLL